MIPGQPEDKEKGLTSNKAAKSGLFYGYVVAAAGFSIWLTGWGTSSPTFGIFFVPVLTEFGWGRAETALAYSLAMFIQAALAIAMGWLTDKLGPKIVVAVFGSFLGISYLLLSRVNAIWQFQINYALVAAIGLSTVTIPVMATIARWFIKKRGLMIGIIQTGVGIGGIIFAPLTSWLILNYGWRSSYVVLGFITLVCIITSGLFLKRDPRDTGQLPDGASKITTPEIKRQSPSIQTVGLSLREAVRTSRFWIIAGVYFSFGFYRTTFLTHIAAHVQDMGFSLANAANIVATINGASIIGRIGMGRTADMIGNKPALIISYAAGIISLIWGLVAGDLWGFYLFALIFGFSWGAQAVLRFAVASEAFGLVSLGLVFGVLGLAESGAGTLGSYFAGYIFDAVGNYQPAFWMSIGISTMGIILAWLLKPASSKKE